VSALILIALEQRLKKAHSLLRKTDWPIQKMSHAVSYGDSNPFPTCFKRRFGVSRQSRKISDANKETHAANKGFILTVIYNSASFRVKLLLGNSQIINYSVSHLLRLKLEVIFC